MKDKNLDKFITNKVNDSSMIENVTKDGFEKKIFGNRGKFRNNI